MGTWDKIKKFLPFIGIGIFVFLLWKLDVVEVARQISHAKILYLALALVVVFFSLTIQTLKWQLIAIKQEIRIGFKEAFKINLISNFYGFVTPSKLGSVIRADYLKKYTGNIGKGICNFTLDKILDIGSVFFLAIIFSFMFKDVFNLPVKYLIIFLAVFGFVCLIFLKKGRARFLFRFFYKSILPEKMKKKAKLTFDSFYEDMPKKRYLVLFFLLNIINWIVIYFVSFLIGRSLGIELPFVYFLAILPIGTIISLIPITVNGLGTREAVLIGLFGLFGISAQKVFSMSVIGLFLMGILPLLIAIFFIFKKN